MASEGIDLTFYYHHTLKNGY